MYKRHWQPVEFVGGPLCGLEVRFAATLYDGDQVFATRGGSVARYVFSESQGRFFFANFDSRPCAEPIPDSEGWSL